MNPSSDPKPRYRFAAFLLSPRQRLLLRDGRDVPLIPRYFDLLLLLIGRRGEAVSRREIFDTVWGDVVVTDGALTQAIRILRKVLGDHPKQSRFIRTVSRHGYQFVFPDVTEAADDAPLSGCVDPERRAPVEAGVATAGPAGGASSPDPFENAFDLIREAPAADPAGDEIRSAAGETLHLLGTQQALERLGDRAGAPTIRAWLRETRWGVPGAGDVPILGQPRAWETIGAVVQLRLRRAARAARARWAAASAGGAAAGLLAGILGGLLLLYLTGPDMPRGLPLVFGMVGAAIGGIGAAGVGAGLAIAEALSRSYRPATLVLFGALGGGVIGAIAHALGRLALEGVFGQNLSAIGGGLEGLGIGAGAGLGYALATPRPEGGMATPRGGRRLWTAVLTGLCCGAAAIGLVLAGGRLGGSSLDFLSHSFAHSQVGLDPLARLFGETTLGPVTRTWSAAYEGICFGIGLSLGLTRRPDRL